jgi:hypothetical protein
MSQRILAFFACCPRRLSFLKKSLITMTNLLLNKKLHEQMKLFRFVAACLARRRSMAS